MRAPLAAMLSRRTHRPLIVLALFAVGGLGAAVARGSSTPDPAEVAAQLQEDVARDVLSRSNDFSATIGPLDCVETRPGKGSCLANLTSNAHRADHLMVAVLYDVGSDGHLSWTVRLP